MTAPTVAIRQNTGPIQRAQGFISGTYTAATDVSTTSNSTIAAGVLTITLGFVPTHFYISNLTDRLTQEWWQGMNSGDYTERVAAGDQTLETDDKIVVATRTGAGGSNGGGGSADTTPSGKVTVTFDSGICTDNDSVIWYAEG